MRKTKIITQATMAVSAGLLFTACSSMHHESASYSANEGMYDNTIQEGAGAQTSSEWQSGQAQAPQYQSYSSASSPATMSGEQLVIPLHEERLNVGKRSVDAGTVTIRKIVTTETVSQPVELRKERVVIDREGAGAQPAISSSSSSSQSSQRASSSTLNEPAGAELNQNQQKQNQNQSSQSSQTETSSSTLNEPAGAQSSQSQNNAGISANAGIDQNGVSAGANAGAAPSQDTAAAQSSSAQPADHSANVSQSQSVSSEPAGAQRQSSSTSQSYSSSTSTSQDNTGAPFQEQTYTIHLQQEQPVINKSVVETGRVVARKDADMQRQTVQQQIRREDVQVDRGANAQNVQINGNLNATSGQYSEPAGAPAGAQYHQESSSTYRSQSTVQPSSEDQFRDNQTLDEINKGNNTRGGAEDLTTFDEKANSSRAVIRDSSGAEIRSDDVNRNGNTRGGSQDLNNSPR